MREALTEQQRRTHLATVNNLPLFSKVNLKVQTKDPKNPIQPLIFNKAQLYLHERAEEQLKRTGRVRRIVIKGRQQGASTYITARFYWKATMNNAVSVYILSHEANSTEILFNKVKMYYDKAEPVIKPTIETDNRKTLKLSNDSEYGIGTAKAEGTGRSGMNHYFHGSEPAHYPKGENIQAGALQTVPNADGSEIFLETTANGLNWFYFFVQAAKNGKSKYEIDFVPWYWSDEYREICPPDFQLDEEEALLKEMYGLDNEQILWRRYKKVELYAKGDPDRLFKQEYPFTLEEAFQSSGQSFFNLDKLNAARKCDKQDWDSSVVIGCDPGRTTDPTVIYIRRGREVIHREEHPTMNTTKLTGILAGLIDEYDADGCFVDPGQGIGAVDNLRALGYYIVQAIDFSSTPNDIQYGNKRAEMFFSLRTWLDSGPTNIPDEEDLVSDLMAIPEPTINDRGKIFIPSKEYIKKEIGRSTNHADAMILTFAQPVRGKSMTLQNAKSYNQKQGSESSTLRTVRGINNPNEPDDGISDTTRLGMSKAIRRGRQWGF